MSMNSIQTNGIEVVDAAASAIAGAIGGVPASNLAGNIAGVKPARSTVRIMLPPPKNGDIPSSSARLP